MRACSPSLASYFFLAPRTLSRALPSSAIGQRASNSSSAGRRSSSFAAMSSSSSRQPSPPLPFDGSARRGGLLHPRFGDPSPKPPLGEQPPPVRAAQQRCARCGGELSVAWLEGRWRHACVGSASSSAAAAAAAAAASAAPAPAAPREGEGGGCGTIAYTNPLLVVGAIITNEDDALLSGGGSDESSKNRNSSSGKRSPKVLLCKRDIEPRRGSWTLPAGYLELGESAAEGAAREQSGRPTSSSAAGS